jgi:hypothetical protein
VAIIILGSSRCAICTAVLEEGQTIEMFPPFVNNAADPMLIFHDAGAHQSCLQSHPLGKAVLARVAELFSKTGPGHRFCEVCKMEILHPDEYYSFGHFTDDQESSLHRFNYLQFHKLCVSQWTDLTIFRRFICNLRDSGLWKGGTLDILLKELQGLAPPSNLPSDSHE